MTLRPMRTKPSSAGSWPAMERSSVDLPAPLGPTRAMRSPRRASSRRTRATGLARPPAGAGLAPTPRPPPPPPADAGPFGPAQPAPPRVGRLARDEVRGVAAPEGRQPPVAQLPGARHDVVQEGAVVRGPDEG